MKKFNTALSILIAILFATVPAELFSQNITNTLGNNGHFTIRDSSKTFFDLNDTSIKINSNLDLPVVTNNNFSGVIMKDGQPFIHDYKPGISVGNNIFIGKFSGNFTMSGSVSYLSAGNTGVGSYTLTSLTNGSYNSAFGSNSLTMITTGSKNSAFGIHSLSGNTTGSFNSSFGSNNMMGNESGMYNSGFGFSALTNNVSGNSNSAFGTYTLRNLETGYSNSAFGSYALENSTGNRNTAVGDSAGRTLLSGNNNILIGYNSLPSSTSVSNQITLGNNQITSLRCNVQSITSLSDERDKKNISDLTLGLDFISHLRPREFYWDKREWYDNNVSDGSKTEKNPTAGFIAQELDEVQLELNADWLNLVLKDNPEKLEATYGNLIPVMVKAIQELKEKNDLLEKRINELSGGNSGSEVKK